MSVRAVLQQSPTLGEVQSRIDATPRGRLTLDPGRSQATALVELVERLANGQDRASLADAVATVAAAQLDNFPGNLLWDFDCFVANLQRHAASSEDYGQCLARSTEVTVRLMQLYGQHSKIRFRYVHDFNYGFDWARWVRREPDDRASIDPFELSFLVQSERRGRDILRLIEEDDEWYPELDGSASRNPFPFFREPEDELRLYRDLAARELIPVRAWRCDPETRWDRDFDALRRERAESLGLGRPGQNPDPANEQ